ncbi:MAG: hypothetical protein PHH42_13420 [Bacteroidales bacterium]|nr:hypothetical protein [Bacteroidales bacterium]MDD4178014.1 hypothetical protein [Bacteroidales bacterium]MDD4742429.1 hypothetical protein [Bacteroidales bacterium]
MKVSVLNKKWIVSLFLMSFAFGYSQVSLEFNVLNQGQVITNKGTDINYWDISAWQNPYPENYFATHFPFVEKVQLMAALGGNDARDLFLNPQDPNVLTDYDFSRLIIACHNVVDQGLKPMIFLAWVPQKLSSNPVFGAFGTNVRPPYDFQQWYAYVQACLQSLADEFGMDEVRSWWWSSGTEFENKDWFSNGFGSNSTRESYYKLYDYTVAALESVLGAGNFTVGVHSMTCSNGYWDERKLIDHCTIGTNYATGATGTPLHFYQISYYDNLPNGFDGVAFMSYVNFIRNRLVLRGLSDVPIGVAEGRVLKGWDNKPLNPREVLHPIQGSMDAKKVILMMENNVDWFSGWGCEAGIYNGLPIRLVGANIYQLQSKMIDTKQLGKTKNGNPINASNAIDGIAGYNESSEKAYVLLYNNNSNANSLTTESVHIKLANLEYANADSVKIDVWRVDDGHGNIWSEWLQIQNENNLQDADFFWSRYAVGAMSLNGWDAWNSNMGQLQPLSVVNKAQTFQHWIANNTMELDIQLEHHGVVLLEISNVKPLSLASCPDNYTICQNSAPFALTGASPAGGVYSGTGVLNGMFDPGIAGTGTVDITYTYVDGFGYEHHCNFIIVVLPAPEIIGPSDMEVCLHAAPFVPEGFYPAGGTFTGSGVIGSTFFPEIAGEGAHEINYHYADPVTGCENEASFTIHVNPSQLVNLPAGWTGLSSFLIPSNLMIDEIFAPIDENITILFNLDGTVYYPAGNIIPASPWDSYSGYCVKTSAAVTMDFCGDYVPNQNVQLLPGWNLVPVLSKTAVSSDFVFGFDSNIKIVKEVAGSKLLWKEMEINTLELLHPGKAYYVYCTTPASISFPPFSQQAVLELNQKEGIVSPFAIVAPTPISHVVALEANAVAQLKKGDILAAVSQNELCTGLVEVGDEQTAFVLSGDDVTTVENDGLTDGEKIRYRLYRPGSGQYFDLELLWDANYPNGDTFVAHGVSVATSINLQYVGISASDNSCTNAGPNTTNAVVNISGI